jgi:hypothetical protein
VVLAPRLDTGDFATGPSADAPVPTCSAARPEDAKYGDTLGGGREARAARELGRREEASARRQRPARALAAQSSHGNDATSHPSLAYLVKPDMFGNKPDMLGTVKPGPYSTAGTPLA